MLDRVLAERIQKVNVALDIGPGLRPQAFCYAISIGLYIAFELGTYNAGVHE
jgi:hypothetical protein